MRGEGGQSAETEKRPIVPSGSLQKGEEREGKRQGGKTRMRGGRGDLEKASAQPVSYK